MRYLASVSGACAMVLCSCAIEPGPMQGSSHVEEIDEARLAQYPIEVHPIKVEWDAGSPFVRLLYTSNALPPGSSYSTYTEYWAGTHSTAVDSLTSISVTISPLVPLGPMDAAISSFLAPNGNFDSPITAPQVVQANDWTQGTYSSSAAKKRLFKATDPDNTSHFIGVLIEQNSSNVLTGIVWYRTTNTSGMVYDRLVSSLSFSAVYDGSSNPSTNPNDIESTTWYYIEAP